MCSSVFVLETKIDGTRRRLSGCARVTRCHVRDPETVLELRSRARRGAGSAGEPLVIRRAPAARSSRSRGRSAGSSGCRRGAAARRRGPTVRAERDPWRSRARADLVGRAGARRAARPDAAELGARHGSPHGRAPLRGDVHLRRGSSRSSRRDAGRGAQSRLSTRPARSPPLLESGASRAAHASASSHGTRLGRLTAGRAGGRSGGESSMRALWRRWPSSPPRSRARSGSSSRSCRPQPPRRCRSERGRESARVPARRRAPRTSARPTRSRC